MTYTNKIKAQSIIDMTPVISPEFHMEDDLEEEESQSPIATLLQMALMGEYQQWDLYVAYASRLKGLARSPIADEFKSHAGEEQGHIDLLQRYLVSMGVVPTLERKPVPEIIGNRTDGPHPIKEIIDLQLKFERDAVALYEKILAALPENTALKIDIENVLIKEQEHVHDLELLLNSATAKVQAGAKNIPKKGDPKFHQYKIAVDTVKNPLKGKFLGGMSLEEAKKLLKDNYGYSDKDLKDFEVNSYFIPSEHGETTRPQAGYSKDCDCAGGCKESCSCPATCSCKKGFLSRVETKWCSQALKELTPDIYARWYQGNLLSAQEKTFVIQAIALKWGLKDKRAMLRFLDSSKA